ncbi:hypothetical protein A9762_21415 [Pandoraea sp. ISTKB]|nr:hypothetical protein A9762_21415 [Pandoraea sp. ISTKB]
MRQKTREQQDAYFSDTLEWIRAKHGAENVFYAEIHRDETTPHLYAYVVPIDSRGRLNCRAFLGGAKALTQMQTNFAQQVGYPHCLERGIEKSKAKHMEIRRWNGQQNAMETRLEATSRRLTGMTNVTAKLARALIEHNPHVATELGFVRQRRQPETTTGREM